MPMYLLLKYLHWKSQATYAWLDISSNYSSGFLYVKPIVPSNASIEYLVNKKFIRKHDWVCLSETHKPKHSINTASNIQNRTAAVRRSDFLTGVTYWFNEYLHVGHVAFDSVVLQLFRVVKVLCNK